MPLDPEVVAVKNKMLKDATQLSWRVLDFWLTLTAQAIVAHRKVWEKDA